MKSRIVYAGLTAALALAACAPATVKKAQDDSALEKLAIERWDLLIGHHAEKAWDFLSPGTRATETRDKYAAEMNSRPVHWKSVEYIDRKCDDPDACTVQLRADYSITMNARMGEVSSRTLLWERWIKVDGRWYYLPEHTPLTPKGATH